MLGFPLTRTLRVVFTSHEVGVGVVIRGVKLYDLVKTEFRFRLRPRRLRSNENWVVEVASRGGRSKPITRRGNVSFYWLILTLLLQIRTIWSLLESEENENHLILPTPMPSRSRLCLRLRSLIFTLS